MEGAITDRATAAAALRVSPVPASDGDVVDVGGKTAFRFDLAPFLRLWNDGVQVDAERLERALAPLLQEIAPGERAHFDDTGFLLVVRKSLSDQAFPIALAVRDSLLALTFGDGRFADSRIGRALIDWNTPEHTPARSVTGSPNRSAKSGASAGAHRVEHLLGFLKVCSLERNAVVSFQCFPFSAPRPQRLMLEGQTDDRSALDEMMLARSFALARRIEALGMR